MLTHSKSLLTVSCPYNLQGLRPANSITIPYLIPHSKWPLYSFFSICILISNKSLSHFYVYVIMSPQNVAPDRNLLFAFYLSLWKEKSFFFFFITIRESKTLIIKWEAYYAAYTKTTDVTAVCSHLCNKSLLKSSVSDTPGRCGAKTNKAM